MCEGGKGGRKPHYVWTFCFSPRRIPTYSSVVSKLAVAYWRCDQKHSETQCSSCGLGVRNSLY